MSFKFLLDLLIVASFAGIIFLIARTLPRIDDSDLDVSDMKSSRLVAYLEIIDEKIHIGTEKLLRRFRVAVLKMDNSVTKKIDSYKKDADNKNDILDIKDKD